MNDFSKPKPGTAVELTKRWNAAKAVYDNSKLNVALRNRILQHMSVEDYNQWETIDIAEIIGAYAKVTLRGKMGFLVLWYFSNEEMNIALGMSSPGFASALNEPFAWFSE